jgi:hypothetical protein
MQEGTKDLILRAPMGRQIVSDFAQLTEWRRSLRELPQRWLGYFRVSIRIGLSLDHIHDAGYPRGQ